MWHVGLVPPRGSDPCPLHWKLRVLTTGPPGTSPCFLLHAQSHGPSDFCALLVSRAVHTLFSSRMFSRSLSAELISVFRCDGRVMSSSVRFSHSVVSDSLRPHESQHARPPCPSPTPEYIGSCKTQWDEGTRGKNRSTGLDCTSPQWVGEPKQESDPHTGAIV